MINTCQYCKLNQFIWLCGIRQEKATASNEILPALYDVMIIANIRVKERCSSLQRPYKLWKSSAILSNILAESSCIHLKVKSIGVHHLQLSFFCSWKVWWWFCDKKCYSILESLQLDQNVTWIALWRLEARSRHGTSTDTASRVILESVRKLFKALRMIWQILSKEYQKKHQRQHWRSMWWKYILLLLVWSRFGKETFPWNL